MMTPWGNIIGYAMDAGRCLCQFPCCVHTISRDVLTLYDAVKHGDELHRKWLNAAIEAHFDGKPVPPPNK